MTDAWGGAWGDAWGGAWGEDSLTPEERREVVRLYSALVILVALSSAI